LKTPGSGPHGLIADKEGNIWYTGNAKAHIGKLNPKTGEVTEYPMPDPAARDPHTPIFDPKGILWFTVQLGNFVGKVDPATGKVTLKQSPTPNSAPYGMRLDSKGNPWYSEFRTNKVARINPDTMEITEFTLPQGARPRRLAIAPDDRVYYSDYARGYLGRLDPKTGKTEEWPSPGGPRSMPYAILAMPVGTMWYSESDIQPNTRVRFDPKDNSFMKWPIPSGGGVLRHFVATKDGSKIYIACSGVNKVGIVEITKAASNWVGIPHENEISREMLRAAGRARVFQCDSNRRGPSCRNVEDECGKIEIQPWAGVSEQHRQVRARRGRHQTSCGRYRYKRQENPERIHRQVRREGLPHETIDRRKTEPQRSRCRFLEKNRRLYIRANKQIQRENAYHRPAQDFQRRQHPRGHHYGYEYSGPEVEQLFSV